MLTVFGSNFQTTLVAADNKKAIQTPKEAVSNKSLANDNNEGLSFALLPNVQRFNEQGTCEPNDRDDVPTKVRQNSQGTCEPNDRTTDFLLANRTLLC